MKNPYIMIPLFVVCFMLLGGIAIYFIMRSLKTTEEENEEKTDFQSMIKLEKRFIKSGKLRENRCLVFISISLDNYRNL